MCVCFCISNIQVVETPIILSYTHYMIVRGRIFSWVTALISLSCLLGIGAETGNSPTILITPATLNLAEGESAKVLVTFNNPGENDAENIKLTWLPFDGLDIQPGPQLADGLKGGSSHTWEFILTRNADLEAETLHVRLDYMQADRAQTIFGQIQVLPRIPEEIGKVASLEIASSANQMYENQEFTSYLVLANLGDKDLFQGKVVLACPVYLECSCDFDAADIKLAARDKKIIPVHIKVRQQILPGKYTLVYSLPVTLQRFRQTYTYHLTASQEVQIGVITDEGINKLISVPSMLFVPGFIILSVWLFIWLKLNPNSAALKPDDKAFWAFAIAVSLLVVVIYTPLSRWIAAGFPGLAPFFAHPGDLRGSYGFQDIFNLWMLSFVGAVLLAVIPYLILKAILAYRRYKTRFAPNGEDGIIETLQKLAGRQEGLLLPNYSEGGTTHFILARQGEVYWVIDQIQIRTGSDELFNKLSEIISQNNSKEMVDLLNKYKGSGQDLTYAPQSPRLVKLENVHIEADKRCFIKIDQI